MNQAGKPADATRPDKRERRRGAAGRAAALRRAPSDSDCSGETASLSADSGDRAPRPPPLAPPRSGKTRSRRRGSEWEVLEGLKDGQRFEKRPDVYNGYLHKKRKWPLKGWHKRFFVIDGGILVYARSPTDVARGRLHGSVDVGLSVISAKARRRRIDIDADEFIYHLRAKTPDVFRTWLNVLKAHRLYRQHLLTFGARESIPKIHPPLEDLPATDTSSRTSNDAPNKPEYPSSLLPTFPIDFESSVYTNKDKSSIFKWQLETYTKNSLIPLNFTDEQDLYVKGEDNITHNHIFSNNKSSNSPGTTLKGKPVIQIDLELRNSFKNITALEKCVINELRIKYKKDFAADDRMTDPSETFRSEKSPKITKTPYFKPQKSTAVCCFLTRWKKQEYYGSEMRSSRKCTNLPKYRNERTEPPLNMSSDKCLLLGKYRLTEPKQAFTVKTTNKAVACKTICKQNNEVQVKLEDKKSEKNVSTITVDTDEITKNVIISILHQNKIASEEDVKYCLDHVFKDLYDNNLNHQLYPVKTLFRNLLEYWLKNKTVAKYKEVMNCDKGVNNQSYIHFTRDKKISNLYLEMNSKETQCDVLKDPHTNSKNEDRHKEKRNSDIQVKSLSKYSLFGENQSLENERLIKNIVYFCEKTKKITAKVINTYQITPTEEIDLGQEYLNDVLDKVTTIYTKVKKIEDTSDSHNKPKLHQNTVVSKHFETKEEKDLVYQNYSDGSLVINLSKHNLEHISVFNDPQMKGMISITLKLQEKHKEPKPTHLNYSNNSKSSTTEIGNSVSWLSFFNHDATASDEMFTKVHVNPDMGFSINSDTIDLKPYISSDVTSKAHIIVNKSNSIFDMPTNSIYNVNRSSLNKKANEEQSCYIVSFKKQNISKTQPQTGTKVSDFLVKSRASSPNQLPGRSKPYKSVVENTGPRKINEIFILLLLENLTCLSKNVPSLHTDIEALYLKLKKRHDKMLKKCNNVQGLSLLGKIYGKDSKKDDDQQSQFDSNIDIDINMQRKYKTTAINTDKHEVEHKLVNVSISRTVVNSEVQAIDNVELKPNIEVESKPATIYKENMMVAHTETNDLEAIELTSSPISIRKKIKDNRINTAMKCIRKKNTSKVPIKIGRENLKKKQNSPKMRQKLMKEISLLSSSDKVSTQLQTIEGNNKQFKIDNKPFNKNFHVCRLFGCYDNNYRVKRTYSATVSSNEDLRESDELNTIYRCSSDPSFTGLFSPTTPTLRGPQAGFVSGTPGGRLAGWIIESGGPLETASRELGQAQLSVQQLQRLLDALDTHHQLHHDTDVSIEGASPNVKKDRRKFGLRKKKSNSKCASVELAPPHIDPSSSHTALSSLSALTAPPSPGGGASSIPNSAASLPIACAAARPQSLPGAESLNTVQGVGPASLTSLTPDHQLREDFTVLAKDLVASLKGIVSTMVCERGRLRAAMETAESSASPAGTVVAALRNNLTTALHQNSELRSRLSRIHDTSDIADITAIHNDAVNRHIQQSLSYSSSCVSASEFFDAEEHDDDDLKPDDVIAADEAGVIELDGDSSSEAGSLSSEEGSASSDNSDGAMVSAEQALRQNGGVVWTRRTRLPAPRPEPGGPSLWNLLYKNIGKDLSQISMPVTINEPLNMLQRLCEELEYSELLDSAAECNSAMERMSLIAAFAVSAYAASAHRAASKPFNPLLAETYECVRDDRGFRFLAEQVSHHPPISACHAESPRWCFWQEARIKTKFWGKSMEFQPTGRVHVRLHTTGDHYTWNKVTTCVHNLFGGQRWVDQYGDMQIVCVGTDLSCKLNFVKASSWSQSRHEVRGAVTSAGARLRVAGRWSEALHVGEPPAARCLWRPGAMPPEHEVYYGFTRFAMELNELEPGMRDVLPHTDTRLRPDQRALEEGDVETAEQLKHELEQAQRDRRRENHAHTPAWFRKAIEEGEETWVFSGEYWKARSAGFSDDIAPRIW